MYALVSYYDGIHLLNGINFYTTTSPAQRCDIDMLCGNAWESITQSTNRWIHHKCKVKGCIRYLV